MSKLGMLTVVESRVLGAEEELSHTGLVDKKGNLVPDSHFIFTALPNATFMAESKPQPCRLLPEHLYIADAIAWKEGLQTFWIESSVHPFAGVERALSASMWLARWVLTRHGTARME